MRTDLLKTNFLGGEISPRLYGRPDLQKFGDAVKTARDVVIYQHGGVTARPGTDYLGEVRDSAFPTRLIPFVRDVETAYILEVGGEHIRIWLDGELIETSPGVALDIACPWDSAEAFDLDYTQGADTMFLAHPDFPIYRLRRYADTRWVLDIAPFDPAPFDEIGHRQATAITLSAAVPGSATATAGAAAFLAADEGRTLTRAGGVASIDTVTGATTADVTITVGFDSATLPASTWVFGGSPKAAVTPSAKEPVGASINLVASIDAWRSTDVGKHVQINGGLVRITGYASATQVDARILTVLASTVAAGADAWSLESAVWNSTDGYPATVTLHQQRLVAGGSPSFPQTVWGSRSALYLDFTRGVDDDHSYAFTLASDEINPIQFLSSGKDLTALTYGGEWVLSGGVEKPITPTNIRATPYAKVGAARTRPEQVDDDLYYVQRGVSVLRLLGYSLEYGGYRSAEASTFSEHLFRAGINTITFQQSPERVAFMLREDGKYLAVTTSKEQGVRSPTLCTPGGSGLVESMATIPEGGADVTYLTVLRNIDGDQKRYVERMNWGARQDCRVYKAQGQTTITGLEYLAGETVSVVADGVDIGDFTVSAGGVISAGRVVGEAYVGFRFVPTVKLLNSEMSTGMGSSAGSKTNTSKVKALFENTVGCTINGQVLPFRHFGEDVLDSPVPVFQGWKDVTNFGWSTDSGEVELTQPQSYPWTILAIVRRTTANPG